jgi:pyrroloquinoline quinone (PQQ) biosynthesis protein C
MAFAESLHAAALPQKLETHPFVIRVREGAATREEIRSFALHMASATETFARALHAILSICPEPSVRHSLIANVLEEEGMVSFVPGEGAKFERNKHHPTMARKFAISAGCTDADIDGNPVGPPRWFHREIAAGNWLGPFAYIAVGTESNTPPTFRLLTPPLVENYGFTEDDLEFLFEHMTADDRHGEQGAQLIASVASSEGARRQALDGARRGGSAWWQILLKHAGAHPVHT